MAGSPSEPAHPDLQPTSSRRGRHREREPGTGEGVWAQNLLCEAQTRRGHSTSERPDKSLSPCPVTQQSCHSPSPHCVSCGCSLFVFGHPLSTDESTESPDSQTFIYFNTSDYSSSNLRLECGFYYLLLFSVLFKRFPVQAQEELPCAQPDRHAQAAELTGTKSFPNILVSTQHVETTQLSLATLIFPQRRL